MSGFTTLPQDLRSKLFDEFILMSLRPVKSMQSLDKKTEKILFQMIDGTQIETVLMRYGARNTLCVSTQSGCAMGCVFCATGQMGFKRNLSSGEIIEQVVYFSRLLKEENNKLTNIVVMGMGEPFHNYEETMKAINTLNHPKGLNIGSRRFTISTVGIIPNIKRFTYDNNQINLAISLHAATNELRSSLLPINKKYPIEDLMAACLDYVKVTRRRLSFEWALINNLNDGKDQVSRLCSILSPFRIDGSILCHVNVIPLNPTRRYRGDPTPQSRAVGFCKELNECGIPATVRLRRGIEIQAGCGQLIA